MRTRNFIYILDTDQIQDREEQRTPLEGQIQDRSIGIQGSHLWEVIVEQVLELVKAQRS